MARRLRLAVFLSGSGTNMEAIARNCRDGRIDAEVSVVVSNNPDAGGIERAERLGLPVVVVDHRDFSSREEHERAILGVIRSFRPELAVLAGYMRLVTPVLLSHFRDRNTGLPGIINIHPADTSAYQGTHGYEFALGLVPGSKRLSETKITVHFVDAGMDTGPVILQRPVPVLPGDDLETLRARGLQVEYALYSEVIQLLAEGRVTLREGKVVIGERPQRNAVGGRRTEN